jgi:hypothetical protein
MAKYLLIGAGVVAVVVILFILGWANAIRASVARDRKLDAMVQPALDAVLENRPEGRDMVMELARVPAVRNHLFARLRGDGKEDLFPADFRAIELVAESDLARWLMHQNELGAAPSEMELVRKIPIREQEKSGSVFLFRFRTGPSHWASKNGWMAGVAGPYWEYDEPPDFVSGTFSELTPFDQMTVEQHEDHLREVLHRKGLVVPS